MYIEIKRLCFELMNDYIDYFQKVAFTDNEEWDGCYCVFYHWNDKHEEELHHSGSDSKCYRRELAIRLIQEGVLRGYLAYVDGTVVGWCNTNDKTSYEAFQKEKRPELWEGTEENHICKSIVCYSVAPSMRQKGVATKLLQKVCEDAVLEGYSYIEAYPMKPTGKFQLNYHGPLSLYEKNGFELYKELEHETVVRKYLA